MSVDLRSGRTLATVAYWLYFVAVRAGVVGASAEIDTAGLTLRKRALRGSREACEDLPAGDGLEALWECRHNGRGGSSEDDACERKRDTGNLHAVQGSMSARLMLEDDMAEQVGSGREKGDSTGPLYATPSHKSAQASCGYWRHYCT